MLGYGPSNETCCVCARPLLDVDVYLIWYLQLGLTLFMHSGCASNMARKLLSNVNNLYKQERTALQPERTS